MHTNLSPAHLTQTGDIPGMLGMAYQYDQLNRIRQARGYTNFTEAGWGSNSATPIYSADYTYDANGNLLTLKRSDQTNTMFDDLIYHYHKQGNNLVSNRLYQVKDEISAEVADYDIDSQGSTFDNEFPNANNNYRYSPLGELTQDNAEEIEEIKWRVDGKISEIIRPTASTKKSLKFDYDAFGNRTAKHVYHANGNWDNSTYYVRDAQGNVMAVYQYKPEETVVLGDTVMVDSYRLTERHIYGSSRVGMDTTPVEMIDHTGEIDPKETDRNPDQKTYELSNHLGNVLATFTSRRLPVYVPPIREEQPTIASYVANVRSVQDYYPFGMHMPGRNYVSGERHSALIFTFPYNGLLPGGGHVCSSFLMLAFSMQFFMYRTQRLFSELNL
jgi:hypothetical protein